MPIPALLAGILSGATGFNKGWSEADQLAANAAALEETRRGRMATEELTRAQHAEAARANTAREQQARDTLGLQRETLEETKRKNLAGEAEVPLADVFGPLGLPVPPTQPPLKPPAVQRQLIPPMLGFLGAQEKAQNAKPNEAQLKREELKRVLVNKGYREGTPEYDEMFLNGMKFLNVPEGASVRGIAEAIPLAGQAPKPAAPASVGAPAAGFGIQGALKPAGEQVQRDVAQMNSAIQLGEQALKTWDQDRATWAQNMANRELPFVGMRGSDILPQLKLTPEQASSQARGSYAIALIRAQLSGLAVTDPEARRMYLALPNDPMLATREQLQEAVNYLRIYSGNLNTTSQSQGRRPLPQVPPATTKQPKPAVPAGGGWKIERVQ